jgi:hypothetical protein
MRARVARLLAVSQAFLLMATLVVPALTLGASWTDLPDYQPGSTVTIAGDNSDGAGYIGGETVDVAVSGPAGFSATCSSVADSGGAWSCDITLWASSDAVGFYTYVATGRDSGAADAGSFTDAKSTATALVSSVNPSSSGQSVTFTATITESGPGGGTVGTPVTIGSVVFGENGNASCGGSGTGGFVQLQAPQAPDASGEVSFSTSALSSGSHTIRACYTGAGTSSSQTGNSANVLTQTINVAAIATTTTVSAPTISFDSNGSVTVSVARSSGSGTAPSGSVSLSVDSGIAVAKALASGAATFTSADVAALGSPDAGDHSLSATYAAQSGFGASSAGGTLHVNQAGSTTTVTCTGAPFTYTGSVQGCSAAATGAGGLNATGLTVTYTGTGSTTYGPTTVAPTNVGTYQAAATFAGDTNHTGSNGSISFSIGQAGSTTTVTCTGAPFTYCLIYT